MRKYRVKRIGTILFIVVLSFVELCLNIQQTGQRTRWLLILFILLAVFDLFWEIRKMSKNTEKDNRQEEDIELYCRIVDKATMCVLGALDKGLHKLNPEYDPDAERNARRANTDAVRKLDEMKQAGLIDEKEYERRKKNF